MERKHKKKLFSNPKSGAGRLARALSISFYPRHLDILKAREKELNVPRSILLQLLLDMEARDSLLRRELMARLSN